MTSISLPARVQLPSVRLRSEWFWPGWSQLVSNIGQRLPAIILTGIVFALLPAVILSTAPISPDAVNGLKVNVEPVLDQVLLPLGLILFLGLRGTFRNGAGGIAAFIILSLLSASVFLSYLLGANTELALYAARVALLYNAPVLLIIVTAPVVLYVILVGLLDWIVLYGTPRGYSRQARLAAADNRLTYRRVLRRWHLQHEPEAARKLRESTDRLLFAVYATMLPFFVIAFVLLARSEYPIGAALIVGCAAGGLLSDVVYMVKARRWQQIVGMR